MVENERTVVLGRLHRPPHRPGLGLRLSRAGQKGAGRHPLFQARAVPGCHASGFIALVAPLVQAGLLSPETPLSCTSLTGYSGGGKKMIADYREQGAAYDPPRPYGPCAGAQAPAGDDEGLRALPRRRCFCLSSGNFYSGMLVSVPLHRAQLLHGAGMEDVRAVYKNYYAGPVVAYREALSEDGFASAGLLSGTDGMLIACEGNAERFTLLAAYDNLGKGASGAAVQLLNPENGRGHDRGTGVTGGLKTMKFIEGGVCAAQGFTASGIHCGIRKNRDKRDLALIVSQKRAAAAAVYTQNLVKGAPLLGDEGQHRRRLRLRHPLQQRQRQHLQRRR